MTYSDSEDVVDLKGLQANPADRACLIRLRDRWARRLHGYARRKFQLPFHDSEEVISAWLHKIVINVYQFNDSYSYARGWLFSIFARLCIDQTRKRKPVYPYDATKIEVEDSRGESPIDLDETNEQARLIGKALAQLPTNEQIIFLTYSEYGEQRKWPNGLAQTISSITGVMATGFNVYNTRAIVKVRTFLAGNSSFRSAK